MKAQDASALKTVGGTRAHPKECVGAVKLYDQSTMPGPSSNTLG